MKKKLKLTDAGYKDLCRLLDHYNNSYDPRVYTYESYIINKLKDNLKND